MSTLLFVDSNIYLDFYRIRTEAGLSLLNHLDAIREQVIVTSQVEMEFKKHRQGAILETINNLKPVQSLSRPGLLSQDNSMKGLQTDIKNSQKRVKALHARLKRVLKDPIRHDPVYKVVQRIVTKHDDLNLTRDQAMRRQIRRRALRRFLGGYPPRKKNDTSMGDAFNWEWIIEVGLKRRSSVYIVSRDSDYGYQLGDEVFINDWLLQEFRDRTSRRRKVVLFNRLSDALNAMKVVVSDKEREEESAIVEQVKEPAPLEHEISLAEALERLLRQQEVSRKMELRRRAVDS